MGEEDLENIFSAFEDYQPRRYQAFNEFAIEVPRDAIYSIHAENIDLTIDLRRKRKRCINI